MIMRDLERAGLFTDEQVKVADDVLLGWRDLQVVEFGPAITSALSAQSQVFRDAFNAARQLGDIDTEGLDA